MHPPEHPTANVQEESELDVYLSVLQVLSVTEVTHGAKEAHPYSARQQGQAQQSHRHRHLRHPCGSLRLHPRLPESDTEDRTHLPALCKGCSEEDERGKEASWPEHEQDHDKSQ